MGSLLLEGTHVRLSGQDVQRGTFSQRHGVFINQENGKAYTPLNHIKPFPLQASLEIVNSPLSEASVLGFEYGYSLENTNALVLWKAQFGDFANGAQVIIDQFVLSGQSRWGHASRLIMLLSHGYDGQGPDHSSGRLEHYLQLAANKNFHIANCTTPANYFHTLRRQKYTPLRRPLILFTPKSFLRLKEATSPLNDFEEGSMFQPVLADQALTSSSLKKIIFCTGKIFYDLYAMRKTLSREEKICLVRLEEFYPFPHQILRSLLKSLLPHLNLVWGTKKNRPIWPPGPLYDLFLNQSSRILDLINHALFM